MTAKRVISTFVSASTESLNDIKTNDDHRRELESYFAEVDVNLFNLTHGPFSVFPTSLHKNDMELRYSRFIADEYAWNSDRNFMERFESLGHGALE